MTYTFSYERSFADDEELHGFRYCRLRELQNVREQALMTAAVQLWL
ncbi:hypothetical protein [Paenibacillus sp. JGP012]|nr:hypothetical protein [Paenibacillus sp. JGP012]